MDERTDGLLITTSKLDVIQSSVAEVGGVEFGMVRTERGERFAAAARDAQSLEGFEGKLSDHDGHYLLIGDQSHKNLVELRKKLTWLNPITLGRRTSVGLGDRLGLATPGHVRAVRATDGKVAPIYAQQSIREMERTGRSPQRVMDDAAWGVFTEGWREGFGADADHLKTPEHIDMCVAAGYTFYTFDPGDFVSNLPKDLSLLSLRAEFGHLPWGSLEDSPEECLSRYTSKTFGVEEYRIVFDEVDTLRAAVKYGRAIAHVVGMYQHLVEAAPNQDFEVEVSVDETESPTTHAEHVYIASELRRLGIKWVSLAPRYIGRFEKGVDYIGDIESFESDFAVHAAIARAFGPYKLSLHSGSDKFGVYEPAMWQTRGVVHLKTAGTSYLEALHTVAETSPELFREIYAFARERYETDRASYHVSGQLDRAPDPEDVSDIELPALLDQFDARQILHVTFGSVLTVKDSDGRTLFRDGLIHILRSHPEEYARNLERHFVRHLEPFST